MIVDDHVLVAEMWAEIINSDPRFSVTDICDNTDMAIEMVKKNRPDIVIMDINIQPISGIDATKQIKRFLRGLK
jgi:two-component system invasion response regulator UvrY